MLIKEALYNILVRRKSIIKSKYESYVDMLKKQRKRSKIKTWFVLLAMNFSYYVLHDKQLKRFSKVNIHFPYVGGAESSLSYKKTPEKLAEELAAFDVISFDVFDTLILRPFLAPTDLFYLVGEKLDYLDFVTHRSFYEGVCRAKKFEKTGSYEINIGEIYDTIEKYVGVPAKLGQETEFATELALCYANPYMKKVFDILHELGKTIIITTDMYLYHSQIEEILHNCGYNGFVELFVSNENNLSKHDGNLYELIREKLGKNKTFAHVGDNELSDVKNAQKNGFVPFYYCNVNHIGASFRADRMSAILKSTYGGIVNAKLHCGLELYNIQYEYGYICGGIFALGYCQYIHKLSAELNVDNVLFLARDGYLLEKIYNRLYPNEKTDYVYWSRFAAAKLGSDYYKSDYIRRFVFHKVNSGLTIGEIIDETEVSALKKVVTLPLDETLNSNNSTKLAEQFYDHWDIILTAYADENIAAKRYFNEILATTQRALVVDIGWAGSGAVIMSEVVNKKYKIPCEMFAVVAGTSSKNTAEPNISESFMQSGRMFSYCFSQQKNYELFSKHDPAVGHNIYMELLLGATSAQFKGFEKTENSYKLKFFPEEKDDYQTINDIHRGITDFIADYQEHFSSFPYLMNISGSDAYAPFYTAIQNDGKYLKNVLGNCCFNPNINGKQKKVKQLI